MPDGSKWDVPAIFIAKHRAAYYAKLDTGEASGPEYDEAFQAEVEHALKDTYEITDWASNNMNWSDVRPVAVMHTAVAFDYEEGWANGEKVLI